VARLPTLKGGPGQELDLLETWADEFFPLPGEPLLYVPRARTLRVPGLIPPEAPEGGPQESG
jgi:hypothetical protein